MPEGAIVFVTVGTTEFHGLVNIVLFDDNFISLLAVKGFNKLLVQLGRGTLVPSEDRITYCKQKFNIDVEWYRFKPTLKDDFINADLIISHAGAGTVLDIMRLKKTNFIVCVNDSLQENHQTELANALSERKHCVATVPLQLIDTLRDCAFHNIIEYPDPDFMLFPNLLESL